MHMLCAQQLLVEFHSHILQVINILHSIALIIIEKSNGILSMPPLDNPMKIYTVLVSQLKPLNSSFLF
jgi:hypothetical protein